MIDFDDVYLVYNNGTMALRDLTLHIDKREFVFVVGPTGCGKSSLLKLVSREETPSRGRVTVLGRNTTDIPPNKVPHHRRQVGVIFQDFKLMPERTVWRNVSFAMEVVGEHPAKINRRVPHVLELVGLIGKAMEYPRSLSGGEMQRVALARAIANRPVILLADEPTGNLDPNTSWEIVQLLNKINLQGTTIIMATHDYTIVERMNKRIISIKEGRLIYDKPPGEAPGVVEKP